MRNLGDIGRKSKPVAAFGRYGGIGRLALCAPVAVLLWLGGMASSLAAPANDLSAGVNAHRNGNTQRALHYWQKAASAGEADAAYNIGVVYEYGKGVQRDYAQAAEWYRKAARGGQKMAANNLGNMYRNGRGVARDYDAAIRWYRKSAEQNYPKAEFNLGQMYERGFGVGRDRAKAIAWYRKASAQGHKPAAERLEQLSISPSGLGAPAKIAPAGESGVGQAGSSAQVFTVAADQNTLPQLREAAKAGNAEAQYKLGLVYYTGRGATRDYDQAAYWWQRAAEQGHTKAEGNFGALYLTGRGVKKNYEKAFFWTEKAAKKGDPSAENNLGNIYEFGRGVVRNRDKAILWYKKAAAQGIKQAQEKLVKLGAAPADSGTGSPPARRGKPQSLDDLRAKAKAGDAKSQNRLGYLYFTGKGIARDYDQAAYWWRRAAEQGLPAAQGNLGTLYLAGKGVKKDVKTAVQWLGKAVEKGDPSAHNNLAKIFMAQKKYDTALKLSKTAVKKKPKQALYWDTLATVLARMGEKQHAFKAWDKALQLSPGNGGILRNAKKFGYQG